MLSVRKLQNGDLEFSGRLDASQTGVAEAALSGQNTSVVLDFRSLEYISSAGLGTLLAQQKRLQANGGRISIKNMNKPIRDIFMYTCFDRIFEIVE